MLTSKELDEIVNNCKGPGCSRIGFGSAAGRCVGMHCPYCGASCSSQGHFGCPDPEHPFNRKETSDA